jgi:hypothetical protein
MRYICSRACWKTKQKTKTPRLFLECDSVCFSLEPQGRKGKPAGDSAAMSSDRLPPSSKAAAYRELLPGVCIAGREAVMLQPTNTIEVCASIAAVRLRGEQLIVAANRQGSLAAGAVGLDLSKMRAVFVDASAGLVIVQGGCTLRDVDAACKPLGLACVAGPVTCPNVEIVGLSLCDGCGYLSRQYGLSDDNFVSAEVRLALFRPRTLPFFGAELARVARRKRLVPAGPFISPARSNSSSFFPPSLHPRAPVARRPSPPVVSRTVLPHMLTPPLARACST